MIPQANPGAAVAERRSEYDAAIQHVLDSGRYILGSSVEAFERAFAAYLGTAHGIGVANGTDAVELALRAVGVEPGDAVLTVSHTAVATVAAIARIGAVPVFVDVDHDSFTMDPDRLRATIRAMPNGLIPTAILPVHLYGGMADMPSIMGIAREAGLRVVEDCAQAHGATLGGRRAGTFGDAAAFSFYPTKNLGAIGDGGAVVTDDADGATTVRELREYGWRTRYVSERPGVNSRLDEIQAAILSVGLSYLDTDNARRRRIAESYSLGLAGCDFGLPRPVDRQVHVFHQYVIRTEQRDAFREWCSAHGVGTAIHYPVPVHLQPAYAGTIPSADLPVTEALASEIVSLPMFPQLSDEAVDETLSVATGWTRVAR